MAKRVTRLHYEARYGQWVKRLHPEAKSFRMPGFSGELTADGALTVELTSPAESLGSAEAAVEPYLRVWEAESLLQANANAVSFRFVQADYDEAVITRAAAVECGAACTQPIDDIASPPRVLALSDLSKDLVDRFLEVVNSPNSLLASSYYYHHRLTTDVGDEPAAAARYCISRKVLKTLRILSSTRGDASSARKGPTSKVAVTPATDAELFWLRTALRRIAQHVILIDGGAPAPAALNMSDLPPL
jgi:hypothetical protein